MNSFRKRSNYLIFLMAIILLGLASRKYAQFLPEVINTYLGDALWAMMIYKITAIIFYRMQSKRIALISLLFCYLIEISQLYHTPWIDSIRNTGLGGLVLGFGFRWTDIIAYAMGISVILAIESVYFWFKQKK